MSTSEQQSEPAEDPWATFTDFERDYFRQTRSEIDSDKRERDLFLNFAILIIGGGAAIAVGQTDFLAAIERDDNPLHEQINHPAMFAVILPGLSIITALIWMRREKLVQIGIRWMVLHTMLSGRLRERPPDTTEAKRLGSLKMPDTLEAKMLDRFSSPGRAVRKEVILVLAVSTPIYALLVAQIWISWTDLPDDSGMLLTSCLTLLVHVIFVSWLFSRPIPEIPGSKISWFRRRRSARRRPAGTGAPSPEEAG
ncbi:hypothetical protein [Kocuria sp. CH-021]|uniref:hypothetical protein n=1 Tax=Kocuria sp. CH-021 TaxID=3406735 RepID=UPI003C720243